MPLAIQHTIDLSLHPLAVQCRLQMPHVDLKPCIAECDAGVGVLGTQAGLHANCIV